MAVVFDEAQRAALQGVLDEAEITADWLDGLKAGWKKVKADLQDYEGRPKLHDSPTLSEVQTSMRAAMKSLRLLTNYLNLMANDLLVTKGAWTKTPQKKLGKERRWQGEVRDGLREAEAAAAKYLTLAADKTMWLHSSKGKKASAQELETLHSRTHEYVDKAVAQVHKALRGVFKALSMAQSYRAWKKQPFTTQEFEPKVVHIGKATVIFKGTPVGSPEAFADKSGSLHPSIHPKNRAEYLKRMKQALGYLEAKGLGWLTDIKVTIKPGKSGLLAYYYRESDTMGVTGRPSKGMVKSVIHELGHRYYFKHMSEQERRNFDKWFGTVPAVSGYGGTQPREDFAEVFAHWVLNRELTKAQHDRFREFMKGKRPRTESLSESAATVAQKCRYCDQPAVWSLIWADGREHIPVCRAHEREGRNDVAKQGGSVVDVKRVEQGPVTYREHTFMPSRRLEQAQEPALPYQVPEAPGTHFGLQATPERLASALSEAPAEPPPRAPIGRRDTPRGAIIKTRTGGDIQGVKGKPITRTTGKGLGRGTRGADRVISRPDGTKVAIPDSLLQMLGMDWKTMRATRVHDNRMTLNIDGVRYSVYTRRG